MKKAKTTKSKKQPRQRTGRQAKIKKASVKSTKTSKTKKVSPSKEGSSLKKSSTKKVSTKTAKPAKIKKLSKTPRSMEELLELTGHKIKGLKKGDVLEATITDINKKAIFFDIGAKTEGILAEKEKEMIEDFMKQLKVGDRVKTQVISPENEKGQILLSLKQAASDWTWGLLDEYLKTGQTVEIRGLDVTRGGMVARLMGVRGFVPTSQFSRQYLGKLQTLYNRLFKAKIIEVDRKKNRLIFSEKEISEAEAIKAQKKALSKIKVGEIYKGVVSGVMPFGIFVRVDIGGAQSHSAKPASPPQAGKPAGRASQGEQIKKEKDTELFLEGLVHISEVSWEKIENLPKLYKVGQQIEVKVIGIEKETGKLTLSIKRLTADPWEKIAKNFKKDSKTKGKVTRLAAFGAFVELTPGVEGLIHISKIPADMLIKIGSKVGVYIESLDIEQRRISLGLVLKEKPVGYK